MPLTGHPDPKERGISLLPRHVQHPCHSPFTLRLMCCRRLTKDHQHPSSWATSFSDRLSLTKLPAQIRHYCKRFSTKLCLKEKSMPTHCGKSFPTHLKPVKMQPKDHRKGKILIRYCCFQQSYSCLYEISRELSDLFYHVVGPKSLEKLKCSHT